MKVAFRVDASLRIGSGHLVRCVTLASELRRRGAECLFFCRDFLGNMTSFLRERNFPVVMMEAGLADGTPCCEQSNLRRDTGEVGGGLALDVELVLLSLKDFRPDWLVVDHYRISGDWERVVRGATRHLMVIDDLADRVHDCDLLLDQNLIAHFQSRYADLVSPRCRLLLGPLFALLQPQYSRQHTHARIRKGRMRRLFAYFGGADVANLTGMAIDAFLALQHPDTCMDVVINSTNPRTKELEAKISGCANISLHVDLPSLAPLMVKADLAIGAAGATTWERCCLGLPALVITMADNQVPIAEELDRRKCIIWLGNAKNVSLVKLRTSLNEIMCNGLPGRWSKSCMQLVDGNGCTRVVDAMMSGSGITLSEREAVLGKLA